MKLIFESLRCNSTLDKLSPVKQPLQKLKFGGYLNDKESHGTAANLNDTGEKKEFLLLEFLCSILFLVAILFFLGWYSDITCSYLDQI